MFVELASGEAEASESVKGTVFAVPSEAPGDSLELRISITSTSGVFVFVFFPTVAK